MTKEQRDNYKADRSALAEGPWDKEPDRVDFEAQGYPCLILRHPSLGHLCGYVGIPEGHPAHGKHYNALDVSVHGGLTYSHECRGDICHISQDGDKTFWFGFDCAHYDDSSPWSMQKAFALMGRPDPGLGHGMLHDAGTYKDIEFVTEECKALAAQLKAME